jgi:hypothetical protein
MGFIKQQTELGGHHPPRPRGWTLRFKVQAQALRQVARSLQEYTEILLYLKNTLKLYDIGGYCFLVDIVKLYSIISIHIYIICVIYIHIYT